MTETKIALKYVVMNSADSQCDLKANQPDPAAAGGSFRQSVWRASAIALLLPGIVVALGYGGLWLHLSQSGRGEENLARVSLLVLVIGVPCLMAYAGLRLSTLRLTARGAHMEVHTGFPARDPVIVAYPSVTRLGVKHGLSGWLTGAGSLIIERDNCAPLIVAGLCDADAAVTEMTVRCPSLNGLGLGGQEL